jgi:putative transposase
MPKRGLPDPDPPPAPGLVLRPTRLGMAQFWSPGVQGVADRLWRPDKANLRRRPAAPRKGKGGGKWFTARVSENARTDPACAFVPHVAAPVAEAHPAKKNKRGVEAEYRRIRARKIRIHPTTAQKAVIRKWFGHARATYNGALEMCEAGTPKDKKELRELLVKNQPPGFEFLAETPYNVRDGAVDDLLDAYKANFTKIAKGQSHFRMSFRSRKAHSQSIHIRKQNFSKTHKGAFFVSELGKDPVWSAEPLPFEHIPEADCRLQLTRDGRYFLCIPRIAPDRACGRPERVVAIDPGVRTFATAYSPSENQGGEVWEYGAGDFGKIHRLCAHADKLRSRIDTAAKKRRPRMRVALGCIGDRVRNLVADLHWQLANDLCSNFGTILLPEFETQAMSKKAARKINAKSVRAMLTWSHYSFRQRLLSKAEEYGVRVVLVDEHFTSKTCGGCGRLHPALGGSKTFQCPHPGCRADLDRDANGARNILLRALLV